MTDTIDQPTTETSTTSRWLRVARGGAATMVVWAILVHVTAQVVIPPVLVIGLVFAIFIPFLRGERRRLGLGLAVFSALALLGNVPAIVDELTHLDSAPAFVLTLLSVLGVTVAIVAGLGAFFGWATAGARPMIIGAASVFVVLAATSVVVSANTDSDAAQAGDIEMVAEKLEFVPEDITIPASGGGVWIDNKDGIRHTFTIEGEGVDLEIPALKAKRVDLNLAAGTYDFICAVPGHENMTGTLIVE